MKSIQQEADELLPRPTVEARQDRTFNEVTYTDGGDEVMVHFNLATGEPFRAYVYRDSPLLNLVHEPIERIQQWRFRQNPKNPLFFDLVSRNVPSFVADLETMGYVDIDDDREQRPPPPKAAEMQTSWT